MTHSYCKSKTIRVCNIKCSTKLVYEKLKENVKHEQKQEQ